MPTLNYQGTLSVPMQRVAGLPPAPSGAWQADPYSFDPLFWDAAGLVYQPAPLAWGNGGYVTPTQGLRLFNGGIGGYNLYDIQNTGGASIGNASVNSVVFLDRFYSFNSDAGGLLLRVGDRPLVYTAQNATISELNISCPRRLAFPWHSGGFIYQLAWQQIIALSPFFPGTWAIGIYGKAFGNPDAVYVYVPNSDSSLDLGPMPYTATDSLYFGGLVSPDFHNGINYSVKNGSDATTPSFSVWYVDTIHRAIICLADTLPIVYDAIGAVENYSITRAFLGGFIMSGTHGQAICNRDLSAYWKLNLYPASGDFSGVINGLSIDEQNTLSARDNGGGMWTSYNPGFLGAIPSMYPLQLSPVSLPCFDPCDFL